MEKKQKVSKQILGKKSRAAGKRFELKVRADLEKKGWIVDRWTNNVKLISEEELKRIKKSVKDAAFLGEHRTKIITGRLIKAKNKFLGPGKPMMLGAGFPDFIAFKFNVFNKDARPVYDIIGVECKSNGYLDKEEKEKCKFYLDNNIFGKVLIASHDNYEDITGKKRKKFLIKYREFKNEEFK